MGRGGLAVAQRKDPCLRRKGSTKGGLRREHPKGFLGLRIELQKGLVGLRIEFPATIFGCSFLLKKLFVFLFFPFFFGPGVPGEAGGTQGGPGE